MDVSAIGQGMSMMSLYSAQKPSSNDMVSKIMAELDADGDGSLSTDEIQKSGKHAKNILGADADSDGIVTQDELLSDITKMLSGGMMPPMGGMQPPSADDIASHIMDELDTDGDGSLSTDEINAGDERAQKILKADSNGDGIVTKDELVSDIKKHAPNKIASSQGQGSSNDQDSEKSTDPADANKDGVVTMAELIAYLSQTAASSQNSESQLNSLV